MGIVMPKVRIRDNMRLEQNSYRIKIADAAVAEGTVYAQMLLAIDSGATNGKIQGLETREPAFGTKAYWIEGSAREQAEMKGFTVVEPVSVLATHLTETVRRYGDEILTRDATKHLINQLKNTSPAVVDELVPGLMKLGDVQQVLQNLLREQVPIRQLAKILETLGDHAGRIKDPLLLTEFVRHKLARTICTRYRDAEKRLFVVTLDPALEDRIRAGFEQTERGLFIRMSPPAIDATCKLIAKDVERLTLQGRQPIVLVSPQIRAALKQMTTAQLPQLVVLSYNEVTRDTTIESIAMVADAGK
jgi:flagellar biosynthesis protein FlhA